jgi:hypothetical protein
MKIGKKMKKENMRDRGKMLTTATAIGHHNTHTQKKISFA